MFLKPHAAKVFQLLVNIHWHIQFAVLVNSTMKKYNLKCIFSKQKNVSLFFGDLFCFSIVVYMPTCILLSPDPAHLSMTFFFFLSDQLVAVFSANHTITLIGALIPIAFFSLLMLPPVHLACMIMTSSKCDSLVCTTASVHFCK